MSLSTDNYPDNLKLVKVIPIHKGGSTMISIIDLYFLIKL